MNFDAIGLMAISVVLTQTATQRAELVEKAAEAVVSAVNNSETKCDNALAKEAAAMLKALAERIEAQV